MEQIFDELKLTEVVKRAVREEMNAIYTERKPPLSEGKVLYSIKELALFLGCCVRTVQNFKNDGMLPYKQVGRKVVFDKDEALKAMETSKLNNSIHHIKNH